MQATEKQTTTAAQDSAANQPADCGMKCEPQKEHHWLNQLLGEWNCECQARMGPEQIPTTWKATEVVRSLGGLWTIAEGIGEMPGGGTGTVIMTLGYDPAKQHYVGTFIGSMMHMMWVYEGQLDPAEKVLTLNTVGPDMSAPGRSARFKDVIEIVSEDRRLMTSYMEDQDGRWNEVMKATYQRKE
jgi:hypothetical protein